MMQSLLDLIIAWSVAASVIRVIAFVSPPFVYLDAASHDIGRAKGDKRLLNYPPELWAFACYFLPVLVPPLYLLNRRRLIDVAERHPVVVSRSRKADVLTRILVFEVIVFLLFPPIDRPPPAYMQNTATNLSPTELQAAAERGDADAECDFGMRYMFGYKVPKDEQVGITWLRKSADQNNSLAEAWLGIAYEDGLGVVKDYEEAAKWFRRGAEHGNPRAQASLGLMYDEGKGIAPDKILADMWLNLAVQGKAKGASFERWSLERGMTQEQIAEARRRANEWKPTPAPPPSQGHQ